MDGAVAGCCGTPFPWNGAHARGWQGQRATMDAHASRNSKNAHLAGGKRSILVVWLTLTTLLKLLLEQLALLEVGSAFLLQTDLLMHRQR